MIFLETELTSNPDGNVIKRKEVSKISVQVRYMLSIFKRVSSLLQNNLNYHRMESINVHWQLQLIMKQTKISLF